MRILYHSGLVANPTRNSNTSLFMCQLNNPTRLYIFFPLWYSQCCPSCPVMLMEHPRVVTKSAVRKHGKRRWDRIPLAIPVFVRGKDQEGREFREFTTAMNISPGGLLLATRRFISPSSIVSLEIPAAPLPRTGIPQEFIRKLFGQTVTVTHTEQCYLCGVKFDRPLLHGRQTAGN